MFTVQHGPAPLFPEQNCHNSFTAQFPRVHPRLTNTALEHWSTGEGEIVGIDSVAS